MENLRGILVFMGLLYCLFGYGTIIVGKKKMVNWILGARWWTTMRNPEIWKAVNIRTGKIMILHGGASLTIGLTFPEISLSAFLLLVFLPTLTWASYSLVYAHQVKRQIS